MGMTDCMWKETNKCDMFHLSVPMRERPRTLRTEHLSKRPYLKPVISAQKVN